MNGACLSISRGVVHGPLKSLIEVVDESLQVFGDEVGEPFLFDDKPKGFDGVEIGGVGGQKQRLEPSPIQAFGFVPRGVVDDRDLEGRWEETAWVASRRKAWKTAVSE